MRVVVIRCSFVSRNEGVHDLMFCQSFIYVPLSRDISSDPNKSFPAFEKALLFVMHEWLALRPRMSIWCCFALWPQLSWVWAMITLHHIHNNSTTTTIGAQEISSLGCRAFFNVRLCCPRCLYLLESGPCGCTAHVSRLMSPVVSRGWGPRALWKWQAARFAALRWGEQRCANAERRESMIANERKS